MAKTSKREKTELTGSLPTEHRQAAGADDTRLTRELIALSEVGQALVSTLDMSGTLAVVTDRVTRLLGVEAASVILRDDVRMDLWFAASSGTGADFVRGTRLPLGQGIAGWVIEHGEPVMVPDALKDPRFFGGFDGASGMTTRSLLCVPLQVKGQIIGAIEAMNKEDGLFDDYDLRLLTLMAAPAAAAIENARLFEQSRSRAGELAVLNELGQALTARLSVEQVLEEAYRQAARLVDTTNFYIGLYNPDNDEIDIPFIVSESEIDRHLTSIPASQGLTGYIVRNRTSVLIKEDVTGWLAEKGIEVIGEPSCSWLGVPLLVGGRVLGVMAVQSYTTPHLYSEHDRELLIAIAGPTAIAVQNARLYEQAQREIAERKRVEKALRESEERARVLVDAIPAGVVVIDAETHSIVDVNPSAAAMIGASREQIVGSICYRYVCPTDRDQCPITDLGQAVDNSERVLLTAAGESIPILKTVVSVTLDGREHLLESFVDITERKRAAEELQQAHQELERYTAILERQTRRLRVGAQVARQLSAILDVHQLLDEAVRLLSNELGFYHVAVFMVGELGEYAILRAASSEGGQRMLERGYRLPVGGDTAVGYVAATGEHRILLDVGAEAVSFDVADLPDTRSEICLPLRRGDSIVGVLDIHSAQEVAFSEQDALGFQTLADQLSVSIENARLAERTESQLRETERLYGEYSAAAWAELLSPERPLGYVYDRVDVLPAADLPFSTPVLEGGGDEPPGSTLAVPLKVRGQTIGVLGVQEVNAAREWTPEEMTIIEAVADQVAMALDSARLFGEIRIHAEELVVLNELAQALAARLTIHDVLEETYRGVVRLLDADNFYIALYDPTSDTVSFPLAFENGRRVDWQVRQSGRGLTEYVVRTREPLLISENVTERLGELGVEMIGASALSWIGVPLLVGDRVLGMMSLQSYTTPRLYGEHDLDLLTTIAGQTAIALQSAGLFEDIQQKAERERQIYEITSKIRRSPDIATILQTAVDELGQALQTDRALVRLMPASRAGQQGSGDGPEWKSDLPPHAPDATI